MDAAVENYKWTIHRLVLVGNLTDALYREYAPRPFLSTLLDDCIERAQDAREWNYKPDYRDVTLFGLNTLADSMAAIKKVVFEDEKASMEELIEALKDNWKGHEDLRKACLDAPKFGNDDDYVDLISRELARENQRRDPEMQDESGHTRDPRWHGSHRMVELRPDLRGDTRRSTRRRPLQ